MAHQYQNEARIPDTGLRGDLLEIMEDGRANHPIVATSQLPIDNWYDVIGDPALADAILDCLMHNAYKINLKGGFMRKHRVRLTRTAQPE